MHRTRSKSINFLSLMNTKAPRLSLVFGDILVLPDFLVGGLAILGPRRVWQLVLSLFGKDRGLAGNVDLLPHYS